MPAVRSLALLSLAPALGLALAGLAWSSAIWSDWQLSRRIASAGQAIIEGRLPAGLDIAAGRPGSLPEKGAGIVCPADRLRFFAIIQVNAFERSLSAKAGKTGRTDGSAAVEALHKALYCTPTDGFLWFSLGWISNAVGGTAAASWQFFERSYAMAPVESWVAIRRNAVLVPYLDEMPKGLADAVLGEFRRIVANGYYREAFTILTGPGWPHRERLAASLEGANVVRLLDFARMLRYADISLPIPGLAPRDERPWTR